MSIYEFCIFFHLIALRVPKTQTGGQHHAIILQCPMIKWFCRRAPVSQLWLAAMEQPIGSTAFSVFFLDVGTYFYICLRSSSVGTLWSLLSVWQQDKIFKIATTLWLFLDGALVFLHMGDTWQRWARCGMNHSSKKKTTNKTFIHHPVELYDL